MHFETHAHRFSDIILNSDYELKKEIEDVIGRIDFQDVLENFASLNAQRKADGKKPAQGKQSTINEMFKREFRDCGGELEKNVFGDSGNDLVIDFWKRNVAVDVAFNHRSFIGGDLLRFQAAAEVRKVINVGVYVCPAKSFAKTVSPKDGTSMVSYERTRWYLKNFFAVLTVPIYLVGLTG